MSAADYRLMTEATGQRIAAALEALQLTGLGDPVTIAHGGTGAATANGACENLGAVKKSGDTMTGTLNVPRLNVSYNNANGVQIWADNEGGNILIVSPDGHEYQIDAYSGDYLRIFAYDNNDNYHNLIWYRDDGMLYTEKLNVADAQSTRANLNIFATTMVTVFTNGEATLQFSDVGVTSRPNTVILTPSSGNDLLRYNWDDSANEIKITAYHLDGSPVNSVTRYSILVIP